MDKYIPVLFKGKYFSIFNKFSRVEELQLIDSLVSRGDFPYEYFNKASLNNKYFNYYDQILNPSLLIDISNKTGIKYSYIEFNFENIILINSKGEVEEYKYSSDDFNSNNIRLNAQSIKSIPIVPNTVFDNEIYIKKFTDILKEILFGKNTDEVLVITGELIWAKLLNFEILFNSLKSFFSLVQYLILDEKAIWQLLLNFDIEEFKYLSKDFFLPQYIYIQEKNKENFIKIKFDEEERKLLLVKKFNCFKMPSSINYYREIFVPNYLIYNNLLNKDKENKFIHFNSDKFNNNSVKSKIFSQNRISYSREIFNINNYFEMICTRNIGEWVNENDTIGKGVKDNFDVINIPNDYKINVINGQIVKSSQIIASDFRDYIRANNTGLIEIIDKNHIKIINKKSREDIIANFSGELLRFDRSSGFYIKGFSLNIKIFNFSKAFSGKLSNNYNEIYYINSLKDLLKDNNTEKIIEEYYNNHCKGIIILNLDLKNIEDTKKLINKGLNIVFINIRENKITKEVDSKLNKYIGREIYINSDSIRIPIDKKEFYEIRENNFNDELIGKGDEVFFLTLNDDLLYGKIKNIDLNNQKAIIEYDNNNYEINILNILKFINE